MKKLILILMNLVFLVTLSCRPKEVVPPYWLLLLLGGNTTADAGTNPGGSTPDPVNPTNPAQVAAVVISPSAGTYSSDQNVSITTGTSGATIYYTTDGTDPATSVSGSTLQYSSAIAVNGNGTSKTIKAIAVATGLSSSAVATAAYTINYAQVSTPQFTPVAGLSIMWGDLITISSATAGSSMYYTTNGLIPTSGSTLYSSPLQCNSSSFTLKAFAKKSGYTDSGIQSVSYTCLSACNDGIKNGSETGVDCGGSCSACACAVAMDCGTGYQCISGYCAAITICGNGVVESGEQCDDFNTASGDGCSATCMIESGWSCSGTPSVCH
jgi:cysteine-rich repeat protein